MRHENLCSLHQSTNMWINSLIRPQTNSKSLKTFDIGICGQQRALNHTRTQTQWIDRSTRRRQCASRRKPWKNHCILLGQIFVRNVPKPSNSSEHLINSIQIEGISLKSNEIWLWNATNWNESVSSDDFFLQILRNDTI